MNKTAAMPAFKVETTIPKKPWRGKRISYQLPGWRFPNYVTIDQVTTRFSGQADYVERVKSYGVNWAALGTVDADYADMYGKILRRAASEARKLTKRYAGREYT